MIIRGIVLTCALLTRLNAANYIASVSGNWDQATTWGGAGVPGNGDTVTINNGITVTIPAGYQAIAGASASDSTTRAITCIDDNTANCGLVVLGTLTARGVIWQPRGATWTWGDGNSDAVLEFDNSHAANPSIANYSYTLAGAAGSAYPTVNVNGSAAHHVTWRVAQAAAGNALPCGLREASGSAAASGNVTASYLDIAGWNCPGAGTAVQLKSDAPGGKWVCSHCTTDATSGGLLFRSVAAGSDFAMPFSDIEGAASAGASSCTAGYSVCVLNGGGVIGTPNRNWNNSVISGTFFNLTAHPLGLNMADMVLGGNGTGVNGTGGSSFAWPLSNVLIDTKVQTTGLQCQLYQGKTTGVYALDSVIMPNAHVCSWRTFPGDGTVLTNYIRDKVTTYVIDGGQSEALQVELNPDTPTTLTIQNSIDLPAADGNPAGNFFNNATNAAIMTNLTLIAQHNTFQLQGLNGVSGIGGEVGASGAGEFLTRSNIAWRGTAGKACLNSWVAGSLTDGTFSADYNWIFRVDGNAYTQPGCPAASKYTGTPGAHDGAGDPKFADASRRLAVFDQKYLGRPANNPDWNAGRGAYRAGDLVTHAVAGILGGVAINYRCYRAHAPSALTEPGQTLSANCGGTCAWPTVWEYAGIEYIKKSVLAGETFTDGAIGLVNGSMVAALIKWVLRGYTPQNRSLCAAGHDGTAPGAAPCDPVATHLIIQ